MDATELRVIKYSKQLDLLAALKDPKVAHIQGDEVLCDLLRELGYGEVVRVFDSLQRAYV